MIAARLLPLALLVPCLAACSTTPRRDTTPPTATSEQSAASTTAQEPAAQPAEPAVPVAAPEPEPAERSAVPWIEPLPTLVLTRLDAEQSARSRACLEAHDVRSPTAKPTDIMAAADCLAAIPAPGQEIRLYKLLVETSPEAPEALEATRRLGTRLEQVDVRAEAANVYMAYLRRYPKQADARALAQRGVCLVRSLGDEEHVDAILAELERAYGRHGFTRPGSDALERLCAPLPPVAPRPG